MENQIVVDAAEQFVKDKLRNDSSGHDWWHIFRVVQMSKKIAREERADIFICELSALLHDVTDEKLCKDPMQASLDLKEWLNAHSLSNLVKSHVFEIIENLSYKGGNRPAMRTLEGQIVQDADRLDAIGALGIARVFAFSGSTHRPIHVPDLAPRENLTFEQYRNGQGTAIMHFHEKLLKLKSLMNTRYAHQLAEVRHQVMLQYLEHFDQEWEGSR